MTDHAEVVLGDGATLFYHSDRTACTIVRIEKDMVWIQEDTATRIDSNGMSDMQEYSYAPNPRGKIHTYRWNEKSDNWDKVNFNSKTNRWNKDYYNTRVVFGLRREYYDYSF